jgi:hypothetical protein
MSDSCVSKQYGRVILATVEEDKNHLQRFADYLGTKMNVVNYKGKTIHNPNPYSVYSVAIQFPLVVDSLIKMMDFKPNKTYNPPSSEILSNTLNDREKFLSFFIGFIDGDGCIFKRKEKVFMRIVNHKSWCGVHKFFIDMLKKYGIYKGVIKPHLSKEGYSWIQISKTKVLKNIYDSMNKKIPLMGRKWNKLIL